ncbi:MAG: phage tail protein [Rhodobacterales bacterium]|nr:phage tail protein [Rhodobacterales bacterium]
MLDIKELPDTIQGSIVYNPFDPSDRKDVFLKHSKGKSLDFYVSDLPETVEWTVMLNGREVRKDVLALTFPKPGDHIIACPVPEGGGGGGDGKAVLALVATLALSVFAPMAATALLPNAAVGSLAHTLATAAISIAGGLLINALIPPPDSGGDTAESYGIDGPKNTSTEGIPFPVIYGTHAFGGNYIDLYTENSTDERGEAVQILSGRVLVSEGPIDAISDFYINDQPISNYAGVEIDYRLGNLNQSVGGWFGNTVTLVNQNRTLDTNWQQYTTSQEVDRIRFDVAAPVGMYRTDSRGRKRLWSVQMELQYSPTGQNAWTAITEGGQAPIIQDSRSSAIRRSYWTPVLPEGVYDVRFRRTTGDSTDDRIGDTLILTDIGEVLSERVSLPYVAWAAFRTRVTGQLSGIPTFTGIARGMIMPIYDHRGQVISQSWSDNPADIVLDMYLNRRYGGAVEAERIDFAAHSEWRDYCAANDLKFNGIFYENDNLDDALKAVYIAGRAQRISSGAKISVAIDKPTGISMMFGAGNIRKDSLSITYLPFADRVNDLEIAFNDEADRYKRNVVRVTNDAALQRGEELMSSTIELKGITSATRATREGIFRMNYNRLVNRTAEWESPIEAVGCAVGDVVTVQAEMMGWGVGGRLLKNSTTTSLNLDRAVTFEPGQSYRVLVHQNMRVAATVSVVSKTGNILTVSAPVTEDVLSSIYVNGTGAEFGITRKIDDTTFILTESAVPATISGLVQVRVHDQVEEVDVVNPATGANVEAQTISLAAPLSGVPVDYANFIFGAVTSSSRPFRVKSISRPAEGYVSLTGVEYVEAIYDESAGTVIGSTPRPAVSHVTNLTVESQLVAIDGGFASSVLVNWEAGATGLYVGAEVQVSINDQGFITLGQTAGTTFSFSAEAGDSVIVRVIAIDYATNTPLGAQGAPTASLVVAGVADLPATPTGLVANAGVGQIELGWNQNTEVDLRHYEIYESETATAPTGATPATFVATGTYFIRTSLSFGATRYYWIRAVDFSGNRSPWSASVSATALGYGGSEAAPAYPANLGVTTDLIGDGRARVIASWDPVPGITRYEVEFLVAGWTSSFVTTTTSYAFEVPTNISVQVRVRSISVFDQLGEVSPYVSITSARDLTPPPTPLGFGALAGINQVFLNWTAVTVSDLDYYEVFVNDTGVAPTAITPTDLQTASNFTSIPDLTTDVTYYFWVRAVDTSGNRSDWTTAATAIPFGLEILAENLVGQITETQIADDAISTPKLAANAVVADKIAANTITAAHIAANTITASQIAAGTITAAEIAAGTITGENLAATNLITSEAQIGNGVITNAKIGNLQVDSAKIADLTVGTQKIGNSAVTGAAAAFGSAGASISAWTNVAQFWAGTEGGRTFIAWAQIEPVSGPGGGGGSAGIGQFRMLINGTVVYNSPIVGTDNFPVLRNAISNAGSTHVLVQILKTSGDGNFSGSAFIVGMEFKK